MENWTHIPMKMKMTTTRSFRHDDQNSSSAKPRVPNRDTIANYDYRQSRITYTIVERLTDDYPEDRYPRRYWHEVFTPILNRRHCYCDF